MLLKVQLLLLLVICFNCIAKPWRLCHEDKEYRPYIYVAPENSLSSGLLIDILNQAANTMNIELSFTALPWKRCKQGVKDGIYDGIFAMIKTEHRSKQFAYPADQQSYLNEVDYIILYKNRSFLHRAELAGKLFSEKGKFNIEYYRNIQMYGLQAPTGYVLEQFLKQHNIAAQNDYDLNLGIQQVALGRLDGYIVEKRIGMERVKVLNQYNNVISSQGVVKRTYWYVPFNRHFYNKNKSDVVRFWQNIKLAREQILHSD
ncbi:substrate-binding periplasmic protein [Pseudoalteromonas sp.]|uniref:substrate-binding periplasmic protein n=1 Tax=Pseudoalteromonas sp. TaxID=53249 RepID=UPI003568A82C